MWKKETAGMGLLLKSCSAGSMRLKCIAKHWPGLFYTKDTFHTGLEVQVSVLSIGY